MGNNAKRKDGVPKRWDKIIGAVTLLTIVLFGFMIYNDFSGTSSKAAGTGGNSTAKQTLPQLEQTLPENGQSSGSGEEASGEGNILSGEYVVCLDAGHGGKDYGGSRENYTEKNLTLSVAQRVKELLEESGIDVVMTRTSDTDVSNEQRVKICNNAKADAMISIHMNSAEQPSAKGAEAWIHNKKPADSQKLSEALIKSITNGTGANDRGVKYGSIADAQKNYYVNAYSSCASTVLELGFITNSEDIKLVTDRLDETAAAIAGGIVDYLSETEG